MPWWGICQQRKAHAAEQKALNDGEEPDTTCGAKLEDGSTCQKRCCYRIVYKDTVLSRHSQRPPSPKVWKNFLGARLDIMSVLQI
jgi:hypothetical protein